jgi:hypothetical protein
MSKHVKSRIDYDIGDGTSYSDNTIRAAIAWAEKQYPDGSVFECPGGYVEVRNDWGGLLGYVTSEPEWEACNHG